MRIVKLDFWERDEEQALVAEQKEKHFDFGLVTVQWKEFILTLSKLSAM